MKYELWYSQSRYSGVLVTEHDGESARRRWSDARVIWTNEVERFDSAREECLTLLDWGRRKFGDPGVSSAAARTVRLTCTIYRDEHGGEHSIYIPGWLGATPALLPGTEVYLGLVDLLPAAKPRDFSALLGHIYVERPGRLVVEDDGVAIEGSVPTDMTVVDLRSPDQREGMWQEFAGHVRDRAVIRGQLEERLGADLAGWTIQTAHLLSRGAR